VINFKYEIPNIFFFELKISKIATFLEKIARFLEKIARFLQKIATFLAQKSVHFC